MGALRATPGPWRVYRAVNGAVLGVGDAEAGGITDYQGGFWRSGDERVANIHLVAAAPDLYAALASLLTAVEYTDAMKGAKGGQLRAAAHAALAKAEGKTA